MLNAICKQIPNSVICNRFQVCYRWRSLLNWPSSLAEKPPTRSALLTTSLPFSPSLSSIGNPHHSRWNFSCSFRLSSRCSLSLARVIRVANHSSLAASCSFCVAWATIHVFIARFCARHLKGAVTVRPSAQSANTALEFSLAPETPEYQGIKSTHTLSRQHNILLHVHDIIP